VAVQDAEEAGLGVNPAKSVILVRCLHCRHEGILDDAALARFGVNSSAPIASFVKRLRCTSCGSASVMVSRIFETQARTRRTQRRA
jgi:hypothetical protein